MPFEKGHKKIGGRKKGTPNRYSDEMRFVLKNIFSDELDKLPELLNKLSTEKRIEAIIKLAPFVLPKIKPVSMEKDEPEKIIDLDWRI
ncbi:hypothetical protein [Flagellimonas meishanensis]|uniref:hypothetical protein n=1 Tax=Flagellimonas meishanensis TaxID=2873264 RepID=UPI001CA67388|nr:hypothetical protein [[Muricauda] meishanensis]